MKYFLSWVTFPTDGFETANAYHGKLASKRIKLDTKRMVRLQSANEDYHVTMTAVFQGRDTEFSTKVEMMGTKKSNPPLEALFDPMGRLSRLWSPTIFSTVVWPRPLSDPFIIKVHSSSS
ncbi:hypothetical protein EC968_008492 [Mortierella alpina]|nr:hypothetical protein EC968_008492 [Mortierella alpina]